MIWKNPILFTTALVVLPFIIWIMNNVSDRVKIAQGEGETAMGDYLNGIEETVNGMRTVKIASQEGVETSHLMKGTGALRDLMAHVQITQALAMPSDDRSSAFVYVLVIGRGGYMVLSPSFDVEGAVTQFDTGGDIALEDVHFYYSPDHPLFHGLDMTFKGGEVSAIVGSTGSGKTTILSPLTRLYESTGGRITIVGHPIDQLKIGALRGACSVVAHDIVIFNHSIWENIRYVNRGATDDEVWQAAENAEIADLTRARGSAPVGSKALSFRAGRNSASPSPVPSCPTRRSFCWTRRHRRWIRRPRRGSKARWTG